MSVLDSCLKQQWQDRGSDRAGFGWWEAWAQWRIWDFRKVLAIELQGFKN